MSARRSRGDGESFADAVRDATPLKSRDKVHAPPGAAKPARPAAGVEAPGFAVEARGGSVEGRALDVSRKMLARLRRGDFPVDSELDLHGLTAGPARRRLVEHLEAARSRGARGVLVIHGRGLHSEATPVLREELPRWLQESPLAAWVMAFCTAPANRGGPGALLVLLRRAR
ncbi:MAG TPA: Smr/MutS family protein [Myxococcota bacterium]